ncbi:MAG: AmmeMemoRadiSam system radical SAM enzyme [Rhodospirillales bacterium]|jgi:pyruvate formate lyase activating enzyme
MNAELQGALFPARHWHMLTDGRIQCDVCPRYCKLNDGQRGLCFVRARVDDHLVLTTYGRSSGFCVDPIEKKPLNHFLPGTPVLSFGTAGCNLTCKFCQNWDISKAREIDRLNDVASPAQIAVMAAQLNCRSVAYTYNDPVVFLEYAIGPEARREFFAHMDAANVDLKAFTEDFYHQLCGGHLSEVLETLVYLKHETAVWFEITTLLIPGKNDSDDELAALAAWMAKELGPDVPVHFTAFHPDWKMREIDNTPAATLGRARAIAQAAGLRYVYTGNVHDEAGGSTFCHGCGAMLIGRDWYRLTAWGLNDDGACRACGTPLPGLFEARPGDWGRKRLPVRLKR